MKKNPKPGKDETHRVLTTVCARRTRDVCHGAPGVNNQCKILGGGAKSDWHVVVSARGTKSRLTGGLESVCRSELDITRAENPLRAIDVTVLKSTILLGICLRQAKHSREHGRCVTP